MKNQDQSPLIHVNMIQQNRNPSKPNIESNNYLSIEKDSSMVKPTPQKTTSQRMIGNVVALKNKLSHDQQPSIRDIDIRSVYNDISKNNSQRTYGGALDSFISNYDNNVAKKQSSSRKNSGPISNSPALSNRFRVQCKRQETMDSDFSVYGKILFYLS